MVIQFLGTCPSSLTVQRVERAGLWHRSPFGLLFCLGYAFGLLIFLFRLFGFFCIVQPFGYLIIQRKKKR